MPSNVASALAGYLRRLRNTMDSNRARSALNSRNYGLLASILNGNPNVGISVNRVALWGEFGATFINGYGAPIETAALQFPWPIDPQAIAIKTGFRAVSKLLSKLRGPDFQLVNINAVAGITRFIARGDDMSTALQGVSAGADAQISYAVGWMLQTATPTTRDIRALGRGLSLSYDVFFVGGGGIVDSMSSSTNGVYVGFGAGGGWGASFQYPLP